MFDGPDRVWKDTGMEFPVTVGLGSPNVNKDSDVPLGLIWSRSKSWDDALPAVPKFT